MCITSVIHVAEYLGNDVCHAIGTIKPAKPGDKCPFADIKCVKNTENQSPVCSVRKDGKIWIACSHRLCSTHDDPFRKYQRDILCRVASEVFDRNCSPDDVIYKKEETMNIHGRRVMADYILGTKDGKRGRNEGPGKVVVEMQGGGPLTGSRNVAKHIGKWKVANSGRTNVMLGRPIKGVGIDATNSWKRQQEQLIVKGSIAVASGLGYVLCMGRTFFDYICEKLHGLKDSENMRETSGEWNLILMPMLETNDNSKIWFEVDTNGCLYTTHQEFMKLLAEQGRGQKYELKGKAHTLSGVEVIVES